MFYSGSKLAPDLSLPQLQRRWTGADDSRSAGMGRRRRDTLIAAADDARRRLRGGTEDGDGIAHAADLLTRLGVHDGPWQEVAERFDRAARPPGGRVPATASGGCARRALAAHLAQGP